MKGYAMLCYMMLYDAGRELLAWPKIIDCFDRWTKPPTAKDRRWRHSQRHTLFDRL